MFGSDLAPTGEFCCKGRPCDPLADPSLRKLLLASQLCNNAKYECHEGGWHIHGDPSEGALLVAAARAGLGDLRLQWPRRWEIAPGPGRPWMATGCQKGSQVMVAIKGAPEAILPRSANVEVASRPLTPSARSRWLRRGRAMAQMGLRVFAVAELQAECLDCEDPRAFPVEGWTFLGLAGLADPPRPESRQLLASLRRAGIRPIMVTGDHPATAKAIARQLDLTGLPLLKVDAGSPCPPPDSDVLARVTPEGKYRLVGALQEAGAAVAMLGDGVNDAPALHAADVGIAMGTGSEVAKQAAEAILVATGLGALLNAILEGRTAFRNIQSAADYLITCSAAMTIAVLLATAVGSPLPLTPLQILYLNLLVHTFPALGLALGNESTNSRLPVPRRVMLLGTSRLAAIGWHGSVLAVIALAVGSLGQSHAGTAHGRTMFFVTIAFSLGWH
ncbi:MAG: HAD-IC family P-type ATPase, partial [Cyanobacteria bacterium REEB65]|nr:HAD-IC family P-type ATPase [Cyanobacteria bacterium REEB65]